MKKIFSALLLLAAALLPSVTSAQIISGDLNRNGDLDVEDITSLINGYLTGEKVWINGQYLDEDNDHKFVDLGLSVMWATMNVGANAPEDYGDYFAWGETTPKDTYSWSTYKWCNGNYDTMTKYCTNSNYGTIDNKTTLDLEDDAAHANWGGTWRMPTYEEYEELINTCTTTWTTQNGVRGVKVTGPNGNSIFLPAAGCRNDGSLNYAGNIGLYWSSSLYYTSDPGRARYLYFDPAGDFNMYNYFLCSGQTVRAVCPKKTIQPVNITLSQTSLELKPDEFARLTATVEPSSADTVTWSSSDESVAIVINGFVTAIADGTATITATVAGSSATCTVTVTSIEPVPEHESVDLGLSVMWATMNIGANAPEEYGDYFAWGETEPKNANYWSNYKWCNGSSNTLTKYCTDSDYGTVDNKTVLDLEDDVAHANWGGTWRMPTNDEIKELLDKCSREWTTQNGVNGYKVTGPNGNSIFLPAAGIRRGSYYDFEGGGRWGRYWSSSLYPYYDYEGSRAYGLDFDNSRFIIDDLLRFSGISVRAVCPKKTIHSVSITLSQTSLVLKPNEFAPLTATVEPSIASTVTWSSSDESVAIIISGFVLAIADGTATITAKVAGISATCTVTVTNVEPVPEHESVDLGLSVKWANMNVGANAPEEYGDYFAWGETEPKDNYDWSTYKWCRGSEKTQTKYCTDSFYGKVDNKTVLELSDDAACANKGGTWRMPTNDEIKELLDKCSWEWTTQNGVNGYKVTGPNGKSIFLPAAGYCIGSSIIGAGTIGHYWSSSLDLSRSYYACYLYFGSVATPWYSYYYRSYGRSVRAVCP